MGSVVDEDGVVVVDEDGPVVGGAGVVVVDGSKEDGDGVVESGKKGSGR